MASFMQLSLGGGRALAKKSVGRVWKALIFKCFHAQVCGATGFAALESHQTAGLIALTRRIYL